MAAGGVEKSVPHDLKKISDDEGTIYHLSHVLGAGGMGTVYLGTIDKSKEVVAVKIPKGSTPSGDDDVDKMMRSQRASELAQESEVLKKEGSLISTFILKNKNNEDVAQVFISPVFPGKELKDVLYTKIGYSPIEKNHLNIEDCNNYSICILRELYALQLLNLIHRDIKPDNIMVDPTSGTAKIIDFGTGKDNTLTKHEDGIFSAGMGYLAPECIAGEPEHIEKSNSNMLTDEYATGVMLASLYTDRNLALELDIRKTHNSPHEIMDDILGPDAQPKVGMPLELFYAIRHLCERDPNKRAINVALADGISKSETFSDINQIQEMSDALRDGFLLKINHALTDNPSLQAIRDIIERNRDLSSLRNALNEYLTQNIDLPIETQKLLNETMISIDKFGEINARKLQSVRIHAIEYTKGIESIVSELNSMASKNKRPLGGRGALIFSSSSSQFTTIGDIINSTKEQIKSLPHYPRLSPNTISEALITMSLRISDQGGSPNLIQKISDLQAKVEQLRHIAPSVRPSDIPLDKTQRKVRFS